MSLVAVEVGVIFLLILVNGALALSEIAVVSARKARLQRLANSGHSGAAAALQLANSPDVFLSTVQVGITLVGVFAGAFGGATLAEEIAGWLSQYPPLAAYGEAIGVGIVVIAITYFSLVLGELAPKRVALNNPERMASLVAQPMNFLARMTSPVVRFLSASTNFILRVLRIRPSAEPPVTEEEIKILVDQGTRA
ncbi:MAG: CNNM domain-containing protein, partial [Candidatus Acidiferrales bacterium]